MIVNNRPLFELANEVHRYRSGHILIVNANRKPAIRAGFLDFV
ncbi:hypothetical protein [Bradyrhizobium sp. Leo121]|nr:hypothetical protein [Bradyrhizobium sp. Leo121]